MLSAGEPSSAVGINSQVRSAWATLDSQDLCASHFKRKQRGQPVGGLIYDGLDLGEVLDPEERVILVGAQFLDCDADDDRQWKRARQLFLKTLESWLRSRGWAPVTTKGMRGVRSESAHRVVHRRR